MPGPPVTVAFGLPEPQPPGIPELLELEEELLLEELDDPLALQLPGDGSTPITVSESTFGKPALLVATRLTILLPPFKGTFAVSTVQLFHAPVELNPILPTTLPFTTTFAERVDADA